MSQPLSPTAQSALDALDNCYELLVLESWQEPCLAAAIRALVEAKLPEEGCVNSDYDYEVWEHRQRLRYEFLVVADELENNLLL